VAYTQSWLRPAEMEPRAEFRVWASDAPPPRSSLPAQVAAKTMDIYRPAATDDFHRALLRAYFTDNRDISDHDVLADVAAESGVDRTGFLEVMLEHSDSTAQAVIDDHNSAIEHGVSAVPTVLINNVLPVPGAQDVDAYETWIKGIIGQTTDDA